MLRQNVVVPEPLRDLDKPAVADASSSGQAKTGPVNTRDLPAGAIIQS